MTNPTTQQANTPVKIMGTFFGGPLDGQEREVMPGEQARAFLYAFADETRTTSVAYRRIPDTNNWDYVDLEQIPDINPTTGRIVNYLPTEKQINELSGIDFDELFENNYLPAIVVRGYGDGTANLKVFAQNDFYVQGVLYSRAGKVGSWQWPEIKKERNLPGPLF
jgi:hypothetical protein